MKVRRNGPILETIDLCSIRPKVRKLEVIAWLEYGQCEVTKSKLFTDSESYRFMRMLKAQEDLLQLGEILSGDRIVCAASLNFEMIEDDTWGAIDVAHTGNFSLVAVFNNGRLKREQIERLVSVFESFRELYRLRPTVYWKFWGGYPTIRKSFESYHRRQLGH